MISNIPDRGRPSQLFKQHDLLMVDLIPGHHPHVIDSTGHLAPSRIPSLPDPRMRPGFHVSLSQNLHQASSYVATGVGFSTPDAIDQLIPATTAPPVKGSRGMSIVASCHGAHTMLPGREGNRIGASSRLTMLG